MSRHKAGSMYMLSCLHFSHVFVAEVQSFLFPKRKLKVLPEAKLRMRLGMGVVAGAETLEIKEC